MSLDKAALVTMYHGDCSVSKRKEIEANLRDPNGPIRLVIVSSALDRGTNYPNINRPIFLRAPLCLVCSRTLIMHVRTDTAPFRSSIDTRASKNAAQNGVQIHSCHGGLRRISGK